MGNGANVVYLKKLTSDNLSSVLEGFGGWLEGRDMSAHSVKAYKGDVRNFIGWLMKTGGEDVSVAGVSPLDLVQYRQELQNQGNAPATINRAIVSLGTFFDWLADTGQIDYDPTKNIKKVVVNGDLAPQWLGRNDQTKLIRAAGQPPVNLRDMALLVVLLHTGLRVGEARALDRADIEISERKGLIKVRQGKGNKFREIPLNNTVRKALADWLNVNTAGPVFPNRFGAAMAERGMFDVVTKYAYRAKLTDVTPHTLRHVFCKNLLDMGVSIEKVAMLAGHSTLDVTKRYVAPSMEDLQASVDQTAWE